MTLLVLAISVENFLNVVRKYILCRLLRQSLHLHLFFMTKAEYKKELMSYIEKQIDKLTVKQLRTLIASYARS